MTNIDNATGGVDEPDTVHSSESEDVTAQGDAPRVDAEASDAGAGAEVVQESRESGSGEKSDAPIEEAASGGEAEADGHQPSAGENNAEYSEDEPPAAASETHHSAFGEEEDVPGFDHLGLSEKVVEAVHAVGFETPSAIQAETIPFLMEGRDVVGLAQTGTGKTAAFALPILSRIEAKNRTPQALVLAPTRELALQVADSFQSFADHLGEVHVLPIYGGQSYGIQLSGLRRGAHIIVGTPGRIIDHLEKGSLDISGLRFLVLDEADEMLNMGFQEDVERILEDAPAEKQVALFSATMPQAIRRISKQYLDDPQEVTVEARTRTATNITQRWLHVAHRNKLDALTRILEVVEFEAMIVFVRTKSETEELAEKLRARGFSAAAINGDIPQNLRERTVDQLKDGRLDLLVATDVAARGLDVERISHVLNFDIPNDPEAYVHRIGRTGRAGRSGEAILFVTPRERRMLRTIERVTNAKVTEMELPTVDEVNESRKTKFADSITASLEDKQLDLFRSLVKSYAEAHDVPIEDIAAALAAQTQAGDEFLMKEPPPERRKDYRDRRDRGDRDRRDRGERRDRGGRSRFEPEEGKVMYRLAVGKRDNVRPGAIVGALANEGDLDSRGFGRISIFADHSLVEMPELSREELDRLAHTRIAGQPIDIERDTGRPPRRDGGYRDRGDRRERGGYRDRGRRDERGERGGPRRGGYGRPREHGGYRDRGDRRERGGYRSRGPRD